MAVRYQKRVNIRVPPPPPPSLNELLGIGVAEKEDQAGGRRILPPSNPLLVDVVVKNLLPYLDHATLKSNITVCKVWHSVGRDLLRSRSLLTLSLPLTMDVKGQELRETLRKGRDLLPATSISYNFHHLGFTPQCAIFFIKYGPQLKHLTLTAYGTQIAPPSVKGTNSFLQNMAVLVGRDCPNLTHLTLSALDHLLYEEDLSKNPAFSLFPPHEKISHLRLTFQNLDADGRPIRSFNHVHDPRSLQHSLNMINLMKGVVSKIKTLSSFETDFQCQSEPDKEFIYLLTMLKTTGIMNTLKELSLFQTGPPDRLSLIFMNLEDGLSFPRLRVLKMVVSIQDQVEDSLFVHFLTKLRSTLEQLYIFGEPRGRYNYATRFKAFEQNYSMSLPLLPKLTHLSHQNFQGLRLSSTEFLKNLPSLQNFHVKDHLPSVGDSVLCRHLNLFGAFFNLSHNTLFPSLLVRKVVVDAVFIPDDKNLDPIRKFVRLFPNIEEIEMTISLAFKNISVENIVNIFGTCERLQKLHLHFVQCCEFFVPYVTDHFADVAFRQIPSFPALHTLALTLEDMPHDSDFQFPLSTMTNFLESKSLTVLYLNGFKFDWNTRDGRTLKALLDDKLAVWNIVDAPRVDYDYC